MLLKIVTLVAVLAVALVMLRLVTPKNKVRVTKRPALKGPRRRRAADTVKCAICGAYRAKDDPCECGGAPTP